MRLYKGEVLAAVSGPRFSRLSEETVVLLSSLLTRHYGFFIDRDDETDSWIDRAYDEVIAGSMIGSIFFYLLDMPPEGTLVCDGSTHAKIAYPRLWSVLPASMKTETDFTLPDILGITVRGSIAPGAYGGSDSVTLTVEQLPPHAHTYTPPTFNVDLESPGAPDVFAAGIGTPTTTSSTGGGQSVDIANAYIGLLPCIIAF